MPKQTVYIYFASYETNIGPRRCTVQAKNKIATTPELITLEKTLIAMFAKEGMKWATVVHLSLLDEQVKEAPDMPIGNQRYEIN